MTSRRRRRNTHASGRDGPSLAERRPWHDRDEIVERADHRGDAGDRAQRAIEAQLADEAELRDRLARNRFVGDQQPDSDGQVEARPALALIRRREVDGDPTRRPRQVRWTARQRGPDRAIRGRPRRAGRRSGSRADPVETWTSTVTGRPSTPSRGCGTDGGEHARTSSYGDERATREQGWKGTETGTLDGGRTVSVDLAAPQPDDADFSTPPGRLAGCGMLCGTSCHSLSSRAVPLPRARATPRRRPTTSTARRSAPTSNNSTRRRSSTTPASRRHREALPLDHLDRAARRAEGMGDHDLERRGGRGRRSERSGVGAEGRRHGPVVAAGRVGDHRLHVEAVWRHAGEHRRPPCRLSSRPAAARPSRRTDPPRLSWAVRRAWS